MSATEAILTAVQDQYGVVTRNPCRTREPSDMPRRERAAVVYRSRDFLPMGQRHRFGRFMTAWPKCPNELMRISLPRVFACRP